MAVTEIPDIRPEWGTIGLPTGQKDRPRVDFKPEKFEVAIEQKGYRLAWARASQCPCEPVNNQTQQWDPNCELCRGVGYLYFGPGTYDATEVGELTDTQKAIIADDDSVVIRGVVTGIEASEDPVTQVGRWVDGKMNCTVRPQNKLGYYDQLIDLDSELVFAEQLEAQAEIRARYRMTGVNLVRSVDTIYQPDADYYLDAGLLKWREGRSPAAGTRLVVHYLFHPRYLVVNHPHVSRTTYVKKKVANPQTPRGNIVALPIHASLSLDFLL